jgi:glycosyltransferase involved in cell wall biosynthesis
MDEAISKSYKVSVVIPALNEAESLPYVLPRIPRDVHEVILVDGESIDGTMEIAKQLMPQIRLVHQDRRGKGAALRCGFAAATGDIVVHLDADGSTDPAEIPLFVKTLLDGADYAKGSRFAKGAHSDDITPLRRLGNWGFVTIANMLFGSRFSDITYGYNAMWRNHHTLLAPEIDGWAHEIVGNIRAHRRGLRIVEVPSFEAPRVAGEAKLRTFSAGWTILKAIIGERFRSLPVPAGVATRPVMIGADSPHGAELAPALVTVPLIADAIVPSFDSRGALAQAD